MSTFPPTPEQQRIIDAFVTGADLVIGAGAGSGKTSTLKMLARSNPSRRGLYIAYNKAIATDAARDFPANVRCKTAHGLAYGAVGRLYRHRLDASRVPIRVTAQILGIREPLPLSGGMKLAPHQLSRLAMATVTRFCYSADPAIDRRHVPLPLGTDGPGDRDVVASAVLPYARAAWEDLTDRGGRLRFSHDVYLKLWQLSGPRLYTDVVYLDEAQDANPAVAAIVEGQTGAQRIMVGDRCQAIYGWRGAQDAMAAFAADHRLQLSKSFRFGDAVAAEANKWLEVLHSTLRLTGYERINSAIQALPDPDAVLCRSNAETVNQLLAAAAAGRRAALVGGGDEIRRLAEAAIRLKAGLGCDHPELYAFTTWREVQDYVEQDAAGSDLKVMVKLIDEHGPDRLIALARQLVDEDQADVIVSTAHKAKGREWGRVRIASDFHAPRPSEEVPEPQIPRDDAMLAYVAVTRARLVLDRSGLAWVDRWIGGAR